VEVRQAAHGERAVVKAELQRARVPPCRIGQHHRGSLLSRGGVRGWKHCRSKCMTRPDVLDSQRGQREDCQGTIGVESQQPGAIEAQIFVRRSVHQSTALFPIPTGACARASERVHLHSINISIHTTTNWIALLPVGSGRGAKGADGCGALCLFSL
jgi:hypothetical protein